ncbi:2-hydroxyacid dehydrogenase [Propionispora vibrioides]|uniref:D-3-phosphoglycerate dehydrogenase n=1 Tax=Propionispora vibrioides TaxID=112903 RepID=A0A1H8ULL5_9FIRM|nr:2-hydroxyacid dehydrogenase [Propionispora vibrioides]SEP03853.1 D-3-phosphoglycerate dehydrogenase [Propionispora vibrioides]
MKAVVIGDALVKSETLTDAVGQMNLGKLTEIKKIEWYSDLTKDQFQEHILQIERYGPEKVEIPQGILEALQDADYLFAHYAPISASMIKSAPKLKMIGTCRGGVENVNLSAVRERRLPFLHVIRNAEPVADFTLGLMFAETRNIARAHLAIKSGQWRKNFSNDPYKTTLANMTVGIIGAGYIGRLVIKRLNALGVKVMVYDPYVDPAIFERDQLKVELRSIEEVFKNADIVSLHMRVTEETKNLISKDLIQLMRPGAYIINTARADILVKDDLVAALQNRKIAGAALDVSWIEPIPEGDPLLSLDNLTMTTHIAGDTVDAIPRAPYLLKDVVNAYLEKGYSDMLIR